jgi:hypothetical protein
MNAFAQFGDTAHRKVKAKVDRQMTALEKVREERALLSKFYRRSKKEEQERALAMPGGEDLRGFIKHIKTIEDPEAMTDLCRGQVAWLKTLRPELRYLFVAAVDDICCKRRIAADLAELDDPLPEDMDPEAAPSVFIQIRDMVK